MASAIVYISIVIVDRDGYKLIGVNGRKTHEELVFADVLVIFMLVVVLIRCWFETNIS